MHHDRVSLQYADFASFRYCVQEDGKWAGQGNSSTHRENDPNFVGPFGVSTDTSSGEGRGFWWPVELASTNNDLLTNMVNQTYITDNSVIRDRVRMNSNAENKQLNIHSVSEISELDSRFATSSTIDTSFSSVGLRNEVRGSITRTSVYYVSQ